MAFNLSEDGVFGEEVWPSPVFFFVKVGHAFIGPRLVGLCTDPLVPDCGETADNTEGKVHMGL